MMKKTYLAPVIDIEKFDVTDILTASILPEYNKILSVGGKLAVEIESPW